MLSPALKKLHDAVFVITAPQYRDRHAKIESELGPGNFEFVYGIDKTTTSVEELAAKGIYDEARATELDRFSNPMGLGFICCAYGHNEVFRRIVERRIARALVLEDDAYSLVQNERLIEKAVDVFPHDAELVYWGWYGSARRPPWAGFVEWRYRRQHRLGRLKYTPTMIANLYPRRYNRHFTTAGKKWWAHAYTVSLEGAEKILKNNTPIALSGDRSLMYSVMNGDVRGYASRRKIFGQWSMGGAEAVASLIRNGPQ